MITSLLVFCVVMLVVILTEQETRERSPTYRAWLEEQRELEEFKAAEERRLAMQQQAKWEADDEAAMLRWRDQQSRLAQAKAEKVKREVAYDIVQPTSFSYLNIL